MHFQSYTAAVYDGCAGSAVCLFSKGDKIHRLYVLAAGLLRLLGILMKKHIRKLLIVESMPFMRFTRMQTTMQFKHWNWLKSMEFNIW